MLTNSKPRITSFPEFRVECVVIDSGDRRRYYYTTNFQDRRKGEAQTTTVLNKSIIQTANLINFKCLFIRMEIKVKYKNGVLKPLQKVTGLEEGEELEVSIEKEDIHVLAMAGEAFDFLKKEEDLYS